MSLLDAVIATGPRPANDATRAVKKRYSEVLSRHLAVEVASGLRAVGFPNVKPARGGPGEKAFRGGLGLKKVDVTCADEQQGLSLAVSIKSISFAPYGKNLKNRFGDLCAEAITLHRRFPYSVVCALFAFPAAADQDVTAKRIISTFQRAAKLFATVSGRKEYTGPAEKFENVTLMLFQPVVEGGPDPWVKLFDARTGNQMTEQEYFVMLREIYNGRNPQAAIGEEADCDDHTE